MAWEQLSNEVVHKNPWTEYHHDTYCLPNGGTGDYYYIETPGAVAIIPVQSDGRILVHRQYRYLFQRESLEFPAGGMKKGQSPEQAARTELEEETGAVAVSCKLIGTTAPISGIVKEFQHTFVAWDLTMGESKPEDTEAFTLDAYTPDEIDAAIQSGEMWDGFCISAWALAKPHVLEILAEQKGSE